MEGQDEEQDPGEYMRSLRTDLFAEEVYVFTPKGEVKVLPSGATPIDFAYAVHTDVGHRTVGAKVNGRIVPLHYRLRSGDFVEILTSKSGRGPSRDWLALVTSSRARNKIRQWYQRETRGETEAKGRDLLDQALKAQKLPYRKLQGSSVLAQVIRETGFKKAEDFYVALGAGKLSPTQIVNKVIQRLKTEEVASEPIVTTKPSRARKAVSSDRVGIHVTGVEDVLVRLAKCCTPVPGDAIVGYISMGRGITVHREDCPNVRALKRNPGALHGRGVGGRRIVRLPRADRRRRVGSLAAARGRRAHVCRARREHRLLRRRRRGRDGAELVHGRGGGREGAPLAPHRPSQPRSRLRRVPRHAVLARAALTRAASRAARAARREVLVLAASRPSSGSSSSARRRCATASSARPASASAHARLYSVAG